MILLSTKRSLFAHTLFIIFFFSITPLAATGTPNESDSKTIKAETVYSALAQQYLPSCSSLEEKEKKTAAEIAQHNADVIKQQSKDDPYNQQKLKLSAIKIATLGPVEKLRLAYRLFDKLPLTTPSQEKQVTSSLYHDLEVFCGYAPTLEHSLFSLLDNTQTTFGKVELQKIMFQPTSDITTLTNRQKIVQALLADDKLLTKLDEQLITIKKTEDSFLAFWQKTDDATTMLFDQVYFQSHWYGDLSGQNKNQLLLEASSLWETIEKPLIPIESYLLPFYMIYRVAHFVDPVHTPEGFCPFIKEGFDLLLGLPSPLNYIYAALIGMGIGMTAYQTGIAVQNAVNYNDITNLIQEKMISVATFSTATTIIGNTIATNKPLQDALKKFMQSNQQTPGIKNLKTQLATDTFKGDPSVLSFKGRVLASFKMMESLKNDFIGNLQTIGIIDAYVSLAKFYKKMALRQNAHFCFAEYETAPQPHIAATNYWHPFLDPDKVVTNSIEIGGTQNANNIILTGPNAAGKSTTLKALTIALLFAQTVGIVPAECFVVTPFAQLNTYLNIADSEGRESLFQAEMHRAQALINSIKALNQNEFSFVIMDEIFTGTNPEEGQAGAYGIAKYLSTFSNSVCIVATHFKKLTDLEKDTNGAFKNYKVYVIKNADGSFTYPYKIEQGITDQAIALDLLHQEGFDLSILQGAQQAFDSMQVAKA